MRATRTVAFAVACAVTALIAVAVLAVSPLPAHRGADAAGGRASSGLASVVSDSCISGGPTAASDAAAPASTTIVPSTKPGATVATRADGAVLGTSAADLAEFATAFNRLRTEACADPLPLGSFRIDPCLEEHLFWIAEDPSTDPGSAWRGRGAVRSDGVPEAGCAGSLAGGFGETATSVAEKWWASPAHRLVLFRPDGTSDASDACVDFAMVHGGVPDESHDFVRASARWRDC